MMYFDLFLDKRQASMTEHSKHARTRDLYNEQALAPAQNSLPGHASNSLSPLRNGDAMSTVQLADDESVVRLRTIKSVSSIAVDVPPCIAPFSCLLDGSDEWSRIVAEFFILECSDTYVPPYNGCAVEVEILYRYCDGKCEVYVGEWSQLDFSSCNMCGPKGRLIDHESVVRGAIAYALQHLMDDNCPVWLGACEVNALRVYMATCGEYVYEAPHYEGGDLYHHFISQLEYEQSKKWRPCGEAYCCVAEYKVCYLEGNEDKEEDEERFPETDPRAWRRYEATINPGQGTVPYPIFECTKPGCEHFCGDLPKKVVTSIAPDVF